MARPASERPRCTGRRKRARTYVPTGSARPLPSEVGKRLVRFGHLVGVLALEHRTALAVEGGEDLVGEGNPERLALLLARGLEDPAVRERALPLLRDLDRHL